MFPYYVYPHLFQSIHPYYYKFYRFSIFPKINTYVDKHSSSISDNSSDKHSYTLYNKNLNVLSFLDNIRLHNNTNNFREFFHTLVHKNKDKAISVINDKNLHFASLFLLQSKIQELDFFNNLNLRNQMALEITNEILTGKKNSSSIECSLCNYIQIASSTLKWILKTGSVDDGINNQFDKVLDTTATLLTKIYKDKTILPIIVDMIFKRYKKGSLIHDLVWSLFESQDPYSLILIANRLKSSESKDVELARKLLNLPFPTNIHEINNSEKQYASFLQWVKENNLFITFTGETFQQCQYPIPYKVNLEAKYLCKTVPTNLDNTPKTLTEEDFRQIQVFKNLDSSIKTLLADFSFMLHQNNIDWWKIWIRYPITEQINIAKTRIGVLP